MTETFTFTEKEIAIIVTALGLVSEIVSNRPGSKVDEVFQKFAKELRQYLNQRDFLAADFKDLAVKLGVKESVVYDGLTDLK